MLSFRRLIGLFCLALPHSALATECGPSADLTPQELAKQHYVRPQAVICELTSEQQPRNMWKLKEGSANAWPYQHAGRCTPAKGASYKFYGCLAPEGCAIFVGKDALRIHIRKGDLTCEGGMEP
jgi:hypothetical protein